MAKKAEPEQIADTSWTEIYARYPGPWVALAIAELAPDGIKTGSLIASGSSESRVSHKLKEFVAANPDMMYSLIYTGAVDVDLDIILPCR